MVTPGGFPWSFWGCLVHQKHTVEVPKKTVVYSLLFSSQESAESKDSQSVPPGFLEESTEWPRER